jgi:hypothetical protein
MNLDEMISKYLDGELTQEEDSQLRKLISEEDTARRIFDTAVHIHLAVKEDSEAVRPPKALVSDTEDKILMKILSSQPVSVDRAVRKQRSYAMATLVFLFLLSGVFRISDLNLFYTSPMSDNMKVTNSTNSMPFVSAGEDVARADGAKETSGGNNNEQGLVSANKLPNQFPSKDLAGNKRSQTNSSSMAVFAAKPSGDFLASAQGTEESRTSDNAQTADYSAISSADSAPEKIKINQSAPEGFNELPAAPAVEASLRDAYQAQVSIMNSPLNLVSGRESIDNLFPNGRLDFLSSSNEIQISSFLGTDIFRGGINTNDKSSVSHVSQSIAYSINDRSRIGVEVGYTHYKIEELTYINVPLGNDNGRLGGAAQIKKQSEDKTIEKLNPTGEFIEQPYTFDRNQQILWGAAFYEREIFRYYDLYVNGRIGAGASSEGLLSYGRIFSKYEIINGLFLTLGTEGRVFAADLPKFSNQEQNKIKSSFSLIYGLQVKF